ncbi:bifunctional glutamate N-acetyltransferase/amino-acid acetyltransferase ArgJ [Arthrobacter woluwensis]|uniref:bifunctional glutamate N-acetyltransferase/amino-acid acetyltransferase ArgJ n=1 Tax=Arthrobacter woluwensis TaxID=156980 RepID=UPI0011A1CC86|nr:bifunctional glutamate N-acetyltransferase/amino-acid acetyltransferase ArgJ [Arthrobacter woluwensis]QTF71078.1 bifunctional glutamate N-acetyltransferase/amino-acid acetyltransferase ArgJ [Arthrobacter woluwensis]
MSVTLPLGFRAAGITAGLKASGKPDMALVINDGPTKHAAGVFTSNRVAAAPVHWSRQVLADGRVDAVVLNSGGANACTGPQGFQNTHATAERLAALLGVSAGDVAVCSTGLIGEQLPMDKILPGLELLVDNAGPDAGSAAAEAIMTTDTVSKEASYIGFDPLGTGFTIGGMAKGAGMLAPGLATMLVVITTDAIVSPELLDAELREAVRLSFNRADSDGCMSTNDTVLLLASGASGSYPTGEEFGKGLQEVCKNLARQLIGDAEGAAHDIAIRTFNAASELDAETVSRAVARSNLFKTAIFGKDPNWGRVLSAVGTTDAVFDPDRLNVAINGVQICRNGGIGEDRSLVSLEDREVLVEIDLNAGEDEATIWTNDLTHDYVHENSAYSS